MGSAEELQPAGGLRLTGRPTFRRATNRSSSTKRLLRFNLLDGSLSPGLAKELQQPDDHTFVLPLQDGTKWSDGSDLTADDVVFTFELGKTAPVTFATLWQYIDSVKATDPRTVEFKVKSKPYNPIIVKNFIASVAIVPKAVFGSISPDKIPSETNLKPIGSGPFLLDKYDQTQVNLKRNDNYWGKTAFGTPPMTTINHPIFKSNNDGDLKLESGEIDVSQQFTAQIWKMWEAGKPVSTWMQEEAVPRAGQNPPPDLQPEQEGPGQPEGPAGHRLRHRLCEYRDHRHVGLLRARPTPASLFRPGMSRSSTTPQRCRLRAGSLTRPRRSTSWRTI